MLRSPSTSDCHQKSWEFCKHTVDGRNHVPPGMVVNNGIFTTSTVDHLISKTMNRIGIPESQYETPACCMFGPGRVACDTQ